MEYESHEAQFIELLKEAGISGFSIERNAKGRLVLTLLSPCKEIDALEVYVMAREIMLSCKVAHTHISAADTPGPTGEFLRLAVREIHDFISDNVAVSREIAPTGDLISSGWCPRGAIGVQPTAYTEFMSQLYGGPTKSFYWFWSGKRIEL